MTCLICSSRRKKDSRLSVAIEAYRCDGDPLVRIRLFDRLGKRLKDEIARYRDLLRLLIAARTECEAGEVLVEAEEGWDGYWFRLLNGQRVHVDSRDFRKAIECVESDLAENVREIDEETP